MPLNQHSYKLDGVGPVDNRPSTDKLHHFVRKTKQKKTWHVTRDMWHVTCDTWHMTRLGGWTFSQNLWYYEDLKEKDEWMN